MKLNEITPQQLSRETGKFLKQAKRVPVVVRSGKGPALVIHAMSNDDIVDALITAHPRFRASIRRARRNRAAGKGIPLSEIRKSFGL